MIRVSKRNKLAKYENVSRIYASLRRSSKDFSEILEYLSVKPGTRDHNTVSYIHTTVFLTSDSDSLAKFLAGVIFSRSYGIYNEGESG